MGFTFNLANASAQCNSNYFFLFSGNHTRFERDSELTDDHYQHER